MRTATFQYTEADIVDAWRAQARRNAFMRLIAVAPWIIAAFNLALGGWLWRSQGWDAATPSFAWVLLGVVLIVWNSLGRRLLLPRRARRLLQQQASMREVASIVWHDQHITFVAQNGQTRHAWGDFAQWFESPLSLVLLQSDHVMNIIPKRCLTPAQIDDVRVLLAAHAVGKPGASRGPAS